MILLESTESVTPEQTKFWYNAKTNSFTDHDIDTHHVKLVATDPEDFGLSPDAVAHHPHASGETMDAGWDSDYDEDDGSYNAEEWADNNDMGLFASAFEKGWVRGGHFIDVMQYHDFGDVNHDGGVYLQGGATRDVQRCVRACMKRWPDLEYFIIETGQSHLEIRGWEQIDQFIKSGR